MNFYITYLQYLYIIHEFYRFLYKKIGQRVTRKNSPTCNKNKTIKTAYSKSLKEKLT
jgi:hypothetical protein